MKKVLLSAMLLLMTVHANGANASDSRTSIEGGAQTIRETYNALKANVGVSYDTSAGPQLACMGKLFVSWAGTYNEVIRPQEAELAGSQPVADMRRLASEVDSDNQAYEGFISGINSIVGRAMEKHQLVPPAMTFADVHKSEYIDKLNFCRSDEFIASVNKFAQESNVDLNPQTLEDERMIGFLRNVIQRK